MPREQNTLSKQERRFLQTKMKQLKRAKQNGNDPAAHRHAVELAQYFSMDESSEIPIERLLVDAMSESDADGKFMQVRNGLDSGWWNR